MKQFTQWLEYFYSAAKVAINFELPKIFAIFLHLPLPKSVFFHYGNPGHHLPLRQIRK